MEKKRGDTKINTTRTNGEPERSADAHDSCLLPLSGFAVGRDDVVPVRRKSRTQRRFRSSHYCEIDHQRLLLRHTPHGRAASGWAESICFVLWLRRQRDTAPARQHTTH